MQKNDYIQEAIESIKKARDKCTKELNRLDDVLEILENDEPKRPSSQVLEDVSNLNTKEEIHDGIMDYFYNVNSEGTLGEIEEYLRNKNYVGYSKKGLPHGIGIILNRDPKFCMYKRQYASYFERVFSQECRAIRERG